VAARLYGYAAAAAGDNSEYVNLAVKCLETAWQQGGIPESVGDLRLDPAFTSLQKHARFETLIQQPRPEAQAKRFDSLLQPFSVAELSLSPK
jgi:hypothetical protein